jgi:hypothetical protein
MFFFQIVKIFCSIKAKTNRWSMFLEEKIVFWFICSYGKAAGMRPFYFMQRFFGRFRAPERVYILAIVAKIFTRCKDLSVFWLDR